jgi:hypothetical protein
MFIMGDKLKRCSKMHTGRGEREREGRRGAPHVPPQKTLKNLVIKLQ